MKKYLKVINNTWEEYFVYRLNFIMWRARVILQLLTVYFLWFALFKERSEIFGYTQSVILTYILGTSILRAIVFSSRTVDVGGEISRGDLTNFLLRPIDYTSYWFARDLGDKALNIIFSVIELTFLVLLLRPPIFFQTDPITLTFFLIATSLALILYFYINFLLGLVGFWSSEVWGPRFIFLIITEFFAGGLFPLDILPKPIFEALQLLPFSYLLFFPLKVYLGSLTPPQIFTGLIIVSVWIAIMYKIVQLVWQRGLKVYSAEGR